MPIISPSAQASGSAAAETTRSVRSPLQLQHLHTFLPCAHHRCACAGHTSIPHNAFTSWYVAFATLCMDGCITYSHYRCRPDNQFHSFIIRDRCGIILHCTHIPLAYYMLINYYSIYHHTPNPGVSQESSTRKLPSLAVTHCQAKQSSTGQIPTKQQTFFCSAVKGQGSSMHSLLLLKFMCHLLFS